MFWLITQIWIALFAAFAGGLALGWWLWRQPAAEAEATDDLHSPPVLLSSPVDGRPDDLTQIIGIDRTTSAQLNSIGIFYFSQIASLTAAQGGWLEDRIGAPGRISAERWVEQAALFIQD